MKLTFFYQHFWPDSPPYAAMIKSLGSKLTGVAGCKGNQAQ